MSQTIVGVFENATTAQQVSQELMTSGVDRSHIQLSQQSSGAAAASTTQHQGGGFWEGLKDAFGFGDDDDRYGYREAARRGNTIVSVTAEDAQVDRVCDILQRYNPIDIDSHAQTWAKEGWSGYESYQKHQTAAAPAAAAPAAATARNVSQGAEAIPVVEEQIQVGKRAVARGGVRVVSRVTERPSRSRSRSVKST
jgi:ribosomal protein S11